MKLGVRNDCTDGEELKDKMEALKQLEFDFIELAFSREELQQLSEAHSYYYNRLIEETKLPVLSTSIGELLFFHEKSEVERQGVLENIRRLIGFTSEIGGNLILLACKENSEDLDAYTDLYTSGLKDLADLAMGKGITLALEPVGYFRSSVLASLIRRIKHPAIGLYYDMGNCIYGGEDPVEQARLSADIIKAVHLKGAKEIELDEMPLEDILKVLKESSFNGACCLEISPTDGTNSHVEKALRLLRSIGY